MLIVMATLLRKICYGGNTDFEIGGFSAYSLTLGTLNEFLRLEKKASLKPRGSRGKIVASHFERKQR